MKKSYNFIIIILYLILSLSFASSHELEVEHKHINEKIYIEKPLFKIFGIELFKRKVEIKDDEKDKESRIILFGKEFFKKDVKETKEEKNIKKETIEGFLEIEHSDDFENNISEYFYYLRDDKDERFEIKFNDEDINVDELISGSKIQLTGELNEKTISEINKNNFKIIQKFDNYDSLGEKRLLVVLANFDDIPTETMTVEEARDLVFNQADSYYREVSYEKTWLTGEVYQRWISLGNSEDFFSNSGGYCLELTNIHDTVVSKIDSDIYFPDYDGLIIIFPVICPTSSYGTIGSQSSLTNDGIVNLSISWIHGGGYPQGIRTIIHELGHNYGLLHSNSVGCGDNVIGKLYTNFGGQCSHHEYGNNYDVMGSGDQMHFSGYQKDKLNWFDENNKIEVVQDGYYSLAPLEIASSNVQSIKIPVYGDDSSVQDFIYLEYRQPIGSDRDYLTSNSCGSKICPIPSSNGVFVNTDKRYLLDMTPNYPLNSSVWIDVVLANGKKFLDNYYDISIEVVNTTPEKADVLIDLKETQTDLNFDGRVNNQDLNLLNSCYTGEIISEEYIMDVRDNDRILINGLNLTLTKVSRDSATFYYDVYKHEVLSLVTAPIDFGTFDMILFEVNDISNSVQFSVEYVVYGWCKKADFDNDRDVDEGDRNYLMSEYTPLETCSYGESSYNMGDKWTAKDGCNTCHCFENGRVTCTKINCAVDSKNINSVDNKSR
ncbi:hypothetical protein COU57_02890 [Candidatus Pacearchaeota archaeon CG10_big_fil_rev_8_21_14_0_10_32_14]|nr:MAG: hypothetical protein COU57_02890 [Candidatus Pacearchaeota archaeon CG10_big_fil_rev_8_21_14_0_10_32_14]